MGSGWPLSWAFERGDISWGVTGEAHGGFGKKRKLSVYLLCN